LPPLLLTKFMQVTANINHITAQLFRQESGKLIAVLTRVFGSHNLQLAEDVVQDTLLKALENWNTNGMPANPTGWLFTVAKNKALDVLRREKTAALHIAALSPLLQSEYTLVPTLNELLQEDKIPDAQLRMMFVCCHPKLAPEAQVALILKTLCGFSVTEIAKAFITSSETIEKRLYRAKQQFSDKTVVFELPLPPELSKRVDIVLAAIYFIFNEGYNSTRHQDLVRTDLLEEAMRLAQLLQAHPLTHHPKIAALLALFCFTSSRAEARTDHVGNILLLKEQDRSRWHLPLIEQGKQLLEQSAAGEQASRYHLEAMIGYEHAIAASFEQTNWGNIIAYYNILYQLHPSPIVALNQAIAIAEKDGSQAGINAIEKITNSEKLQQYYLLPATLGELHARLGNTTKAAEYLTAAIGLTQSAAEKRLLQQKLDNLNETL
jgi:RNA polymerase sigma factor (sigma-70 family)